MNISIKNTLFFAAIGLFFAISGCKSKNETREMVKNTHKTPVFDEKMALSLYEMAFDCIEQEYPNKLGQVLNNDAELLSPKRLHPAFYGCYDWHSSVHGHWSLLTIVKRLPNFSKNDEILAKIRRNINAENIKQEIAYFDLPNNQHFERAYGWAWLLKTAELLRDWDSEQAKALYSDLQPLVQLIENKLIAYLEKLKYPVRHGIHGNTAFALSFALDYARKYAPELEKQIVKCAKDYYLTDENCPLQQWEPSGTDFFSPCLQEAALMLKVLPKVEYKKWLRAFLPAFEKNPAKFLSIAEVTDRSDPQIVHLDGLNFSRAWCLYEMGYALENQEMIQLANAHFHYSHSQMDSGNYMGSHWLASFALYAAEKAENQSTAK